MTGDCHVRICEGRGVRLPPATRPSSRTRFLTASSGRIHLAAHDPRMLSDLADACEAELLEQLDGSAEEEAPLCLPADGRLRYRFDETSARAGDLRQRRAESRTRDPEPSMALVDEDTGDAPLRLRR